MNKPVMAQNTPRGTVVPGQAEGSRWLTVTSPLLPSMQDLVPRIADMLERKWLTNQGHYACQLETELARFLGVSELSLVTNGTIALDMAIRELVDGGEVITTGFSFPATWATLVDDPRYTPVFVDIGADCTLDPQAVEAAITPKTTAIVGVHAYGFPCQHQTLKAIADRHGLKLLYDAAHAFGVEVDGESVGAWGDASIFSFHATKVFNTLEGGAIASADRDYMRRIGARRNFGLVGGGVQEMVGTNGKMDELRSIFGLAVLPLVREAIARRESVAQRYLEAIAGLNIEEIHLFSEPFSRSGVRQNFAYFPIMVRPGSGMNRDQLWQALHDVGVLSRRYFNPTVVTAPMYADLVRPGSLPETIRASASALCLPIHHDMTSSDCDLVVNTISAAYRNVTG